MIDKFFDVIYKKDGKLLSQHPIYESVPFGMLLAIVGGFLDAYTFVGRGGVFANAQTGNIVLFGIYASKRNWGQALVHVPPILACVLGVIVLEWLKSNSSRLFMLDWTRTVLILEIIVFFIIGFIPNTIPDIIVTVTISFVASIQVASFRKLVDSPYTTTMSTGNLRSASQAVYKAFTQKDHEAAMRAIRYFIIIISFMSGAFLGGLLTLIIGVKAIWCTVIILFCDVILFNIGEQKSNHEHA